MSKELIKIRVDGPPPKKFGDSSMWNKPAERKHIKNLRTLALSDMAGRAPSVAPIAIRLILFAEPELGDLDNFVGGVLDALAACAGGTPLKDEHWGDVPSGAHPHQPIVFQNDKQVTRIEAERRGPIDRWVGYELMIEECPKHNEEPAKAVESTIL